MSSELGDSFFVFWDLINQSPTLLCEDGEFYFYGEDSIAIERNESGGRYWTRLEKARDFTPINDSERFDIMHPDTGEWINFWEAPDKLHSRVWRLAGLKEWKEPY